MSELSVLVGSPSQKILSVARNDLTAIPVLSVGDNSLSLDTPITGPPLWLAHFSLDDGVAVMDIGNLERMANRERNARIRRELATGKTAETLAAQHGLTVAQIRRIARQGKA
ncbi:MAG TPA: hypothetical protein PLF81_00430 [Candidatus Anammoximicrobium sp.]|nr:hypothetical protein [Candidatus Anammoximicrobium sp.]